MVSSTHKLATKCPTVLERLSLPRPATTTLFPAGLPIPSGSSVSDQPLFTLNAALWEERPDTGRRSEDHFTVPGSMDTPWLVAHHTLRGCSPQLSACQALKQDSSDFQSHNLRANHRFHLLWSKRSKRGESKIYSHHFEIIQECEIITQGTHPGTWLCLPFPCGS